MREDWINSLKVVEAIFLFGPFGLQNKAQGGCNIFFYIVYSIIFSVIHSTMNVL